MAAEPKGTPSSEGSPAGRKPRSSAAQFLELIEPPKSGALQFDIFEGLSPEQVISVTNCPCYLRIPAGETIFSQGEEASGLFVIDKGKVEIFREDGGKETSVAELGAGETFGEMGLMLASAVRTASARALVDTNLIGISGGAEEFFVRAGSPEAAMVLMQNILCLIGRRVRSTNQERARKGGADAGSTGPALKKAMALIERALPKKILFMKHVKMSDLKPGETLINEGDEPDEFYFVHSGRLEVFKGAEGASPKLLTVMIAPTIVGELGFFTGAKRAASVRAAAEPVKYTRFSGKEFLKLRKKNTRQALEVIFAAGQLATHMLLDQQRS